MTCALNSLARHVLHRAAEAFTPPVTRVSPQEALRALLRSSAVYGDGSSTAPYRADLLASPESSVRATPVQDLVRREDSEYLVVFKEKILLSCEEFRETVASEGHHSKIGRSTWISSPTRASKHNLMARSCAFTYCTARSASPFA